MYKYFAGIDPGSKNFGAAMIQTTSRAGLVKGCITDFSTWCLDPSGAGSPEAFCSSLFKHRLLESTGGRGFSLTVERFVTYANSRTAATEDVTELIGMVRMQYFLLSSESPKMVRAVEWKTKTVQVLNREFGFENPGDGGKLDKNFSKSAGLFLLKTLGTDEVASRASKMTSHEADAVCLAALPLLTSVQGIRHGVDRL